MSLFKTYYQLTKPGIIYGNAINAIGGFLLASPKHINLLLLLETLVGIGLIIACGCIINNYLDRDIDKKMARTKNRALAVGQIPAGRALALAAVCGVVGFVVLAVYVNWLTVLLGVIGLVDYVVLYGWGKRHTPHGTLIGTISGATPLVAGYTAVTNRFDTAAALLFLMLVFWQMAHFYAIAMYRRDDYARAKLPVWPVVYGLRQTKWWVLAYILAFIVAADGLTFFGYTGRIYLVVINLVGVAWLVAGVRRFRQPDQMRWGRTMFLRSLIVTLVLSAMLAVGARLW